MAREGHMAHNGEDSRVIALVAVAALGFSAFAGPPARATDFYEGKTLTLMVGFAAGGMADADGRMVAQFLAHHIPGNPRIIVKNMPGAGGINAINLAYQTSKPDGLIIYQL